MRLPSLLLLLFVCLPAQAQSRSVEIRWRKSPTPGVRNIIVIARAATAASAAENYQFDLGTNTFKRITLSPGLWTATVRVRHLTLESSSATLTFTVPAPVSDLKATLPP